MRFCNTKDQKLSIEQALTAEWLETNGLGGYASSTSVNCHTRKYHALLVGQLPDLPDKYVLLSKVEDVFVQEGKENFLTAHQYPDCFQDGSFDHLEEFNCSDHPVWIYKFGDSILTKEILLLRDENTVLFRYQVKGDKPCQMIWRPLLALRNFHRLRYETPNFLRDVQKFSDGFFCNPVTDLPNLYFQVSGKHEFVSEPLWYRNFVYTKEEERGYDSKEDLFSPGYVIFEFSNESEVFFSCGLAQQKKDFTLKWQKELDRRYRTATNFSGNDFQKQLHSVASSFLIKKEQDCNSYAVVAGYHWFLEWGRDAMISLPGLTLCSDQDRVCLEVLKTFAKAEFKGLIPNYLGSDQNTHAYNSADASLWFTWAVQQYYLKTKKLKEIATYFWPTLKNIFESYCSGTLHNIKMDQDGLLYAGSAEVNLTWMDAVVNNHPITPRYGYQVEVNALWFNLLGFMHELAMKFKDPLAADLKSLRAITKKSFQQKFWCEDKGYLYDFINDDEKSSKLRPNQIFAVSLPYSPLLIQMAVSIISKVKEHLLTPYGLRTLAPYEEGYIGSYIGSQAERDQAYHNGTVWPWLLGHFTEALLKVTSDKRKVANIIKPCLDELQNHLSVYGLGSIAEIFSGDLPHKPDGCISQAWSVAEVLRLTYLLD